MAKKDISMERITKTDTKSEMISRISWGRYMKHFVYSTHYLGMTVGNSSRVREKVLSRTFTQTAAYAQP
jgi:hypothetical protein